MCPGRKRNRDPGSREEGRDGGRMEEKRGKMRKEEWRERIGNIMVYRYIRGGQGPREEEGL